MSEFNPTISDAIIALGVDGGFKIKDDKIAKWYSEKEQPTDQAIQAKLKELQAEYEANQYQRDRAEAYDSIPEQLDQIYHDMDGWKKRIKAVKDKYPKP
tara:strand:+ start:564 stop:860 length:297 start_codon:yes stop_codon:yes gene_type:complete